jgi:hypothetical protein
MSMSVGASSSALSYLQSLLQRATAGVSGAASAPDPLSVLLQSMSGFGSTTDPTNSATGSTGSASGSSVPPFGTGTMAALISLQGQSANSLVAQSPSQLFSKIDADGDGKISKTEFENALTGAGASTSAADATFAALDANGDGSITQSELPGAKGAHGHHHRAHGGGGSQASDASSGQSSSQDPLDQLLSGAGADGATTQSATNSDGSTTTTITYADGTTIDMTTPATASDGGKSGNGTDNSSSNSAISQGSANLLQELIKLQSQMLTAATSTLSAIA